MARLDAGACSNRVILSASEESRLIGDRANRRPRSFLRQDDTKFRRLRLLGLSAAIAFVLAGCAASPEASRVRGEPGGDPGNHGNPVELLAPPDRVERVYYEIPYDGPSVASEDTSQS
jgi:hypothetical protein